MPGRTPYKTYSEFLAERFPWKMQKLSVNLALGCPNRDGSIGTGGCIYCNNKAFVPSYCEGTDEVTVQLQKGKEFFGKKYPEMRYMAYFQAYTSTYSQSGEFLLESFSRALQVPRVEALIVSTRPDCIDPAFLDAMDSLKNTGKRIMFEVGVETVHNSTLAVINRRHTWECAEETIKRLGERGYDVCAHLIFGLPGESRSMMSESIDRIVELPVTSLKFHQLQIVRGTALYDMWKRGEADVKLFTAEDYLDFCCEALRKVPRSIAIERFTASSPAELLVAPKWNLKNYQFVNLLHKRLMMN